MIRQELPNKYSDKPLTESDDLISKFCLLVK